MGSEPRLGSIGCTLIHPHYVRHAEEVLLETDVSIPFPPSNTESDPTGHLDSGNETLTVASLPQGDVGGVKCQWDYAL